MNFGPPIFTYTRQQAIEDGVLVDVTEWASADKGFIGGFKCPVAMTAAVFALCEPPKGSYEDVRGRAHDVLWMASCAARGGGSDRLFKVKIGRRLHTLRMVAGPGDNAELVITIMLPDED